MEMYKFLVVATILTRVAPWMLTSSHSNIIPNLTDDVTLRCFMSSDAESPIKQLTRIRLLKLGNEDIWRNVAEIVLPNASQIILTDTTTPDIVAVGHLGQLSETVLEVRWKTATMTTEGSYKCEIDGFTEKLRRNYRVETLLANITSNPATTDDLLNILVQMRKKSEMLSQELASSNEDRIIEHHNLTDLFQDEIQSKIEDNFFERRYWPDGNYALLSPAEGCPDTPQTKMNRGFVKIETQMTKEVNHSVSSPTHLDDDVFKNCGSRTVMHFRFCHYRNSKDTMRPWPRGTYCIPYSGGCPPSFVHGNTQFPLATSTDMVTSQKFVSSPMVYFSSGDRSMAFYFCCRSDGDAPILLPNAKPFYLYRYKGKCQEVLNMTVTSEWIQIDTNKAKPIKYNNEYHADGGPNTSRIELCYYSKAGQL